MEVAEYTTNPKTGTVHLVWPVHARFGLAVCGARMDGDWEPGGETVSGSATTCASCRKRFAKTRKPMSYGDALTRWGRQKLRERAERDARGLMALRRDYLPRFAPDVAAAEAELAETLSLIEACQVSVTFEFDEGYACCGGRDPDCYCSFAESPSASIRISGAGVVVDIGHDDFDFAKVLGEIVQAGGGEIGGEEARP